MFTEYMIVKGANLGKNISMLLEALKYGKDRLINGMDYRFLGSQLIQHYICKLDESFSNHEGQSYDMNFYDKLIKTQSPDRISLKVANVNEEIIIHNPRTKNKTTKDRVKEFLEEFDYLWVIQRSEWRKDGILKKPFTMVVIPVGGLEVKIYDTYNVVNISKKGTIAFQEKPSDNDGPRFTANEYKDIDKMIRGKHMEIVEHLFRSVQQKIEENNEKDMAA